MASLKDLVKNIIVELTDLQRSTASPVHEDDEFGLPRMISTGDGRSIIVSRSIDRFIEDVTQQLMDGDPSLARRFTSVGIVETAHKGFGAALIKIDLDDDLTKNVTTVLSEVRASLYKEIETDAREYAFGCTLFGNVVAPFSIGPVRFELRLDWLQRKVSNGTISKVTYARLRRKWENKKLDKRKASYDSIVEHSVADAIGRCPFVCSVTTSSLAHDAGKEKALTAARLALASIALLWRTPSKALDGLNLLFDRDRRVQHTLASIPGKIIFASSCLSCMPHGPTLKEGEWEQQLVSRKVHFTVSGEILEYVLSSMGDVRRPNLMIALAQSLLWFHEGCRENVNLIAIVKFAASMDALAERKNVSGIRRLINFRLGIKDEATIHRDGSTMKEVIDRIYGYGRSRTIHGTNDKFGHDWTITRGLAEHFAKLCLLSCIDWAGQNPLLDEPSQLSK